MSGSLKSSLPAAGETCRCACHPHTAEFGHRTPGCCKCCPFVRPCSNTNPHAAHWSATTTVIYLCEGVKSTVRLRVRIDGAHEEPSWISTPRLSKAEPDKTPGSFTYRVDLTAVLSSVEEFEAWRRLLGKTIDLREETDEP